MRLLCYGAAVADQEIINRLTRNRCSRCTPFGIKPDGLKPGGWSLGWSLAGGGAVFRAGAGPRAGKLLPAGLRLSDCPQGVPLRARRDRRGRGVLGIRQLPKQLRRVQLLPRARRGRLLP
eukprot:8031270-Pyramimonas_sp.AAC.1